MTALRWRSCSTSLKTASIYISPASRLEAQGLVAKVVNESDRRLVSLSLTSEGRALMARLVPIALDFQKEMTEVLGADAALFEASLDKLMKAKL